MERVTRPPSFRWRANPRQPELEAKLQREVGVCALTAAVLVARGLDDPAAAHDFLHPRLEDLHDPALLPDYQPAVGELMAARERGDLVFVHGDYDVDGITSAALLTRSLRKMGFKVEAHVPHRLKEGYGIHADMVQRASELGAKLFLTCDCGVGAHDQVEQARALGMRVVVTDHHEVGETLPNAQAVVNPKRKDSQYPFSSLSGVGVAFKLASGLARELGMPVNLFYKNYLDLAALGTVSDVMPLVDENRIIVAHGLERLVETKKVGLRALLKVCQLTGKVTAQNVGFQIGPRINAVGRMDDAGIALKLLLTSEEQEAKEIAEVLDQANRARKEEQETVFRDALEHIERHALLNHRVLVVAGNMWRAGLIGIVAGKLVERFYRPALVVSFDSSGVGRASARSIPGFNLKDAIDEHMPLLLGGGGHTLAAGFSIEWEKLPAFKQSMQDYAAKILTDEDLVPSLNIDAVVGAHEAGPEVVTDLDRLEPFGEANPKPMFLCQDMKVVRVNPMRNQEHARLSLQGGEGPLRTALAWGTGLEWSAVATGAAVDVVFRPEVNEYNGESQFRWSVSDFRVLSS